MSKPQIHQSMISTLLNCGKQYEYRYIEGIIRPPSVAMHIGTAVHRGVEINLRHKAEKGELLQRADVTDAAVETFAAAWKMEGAHLSRDERLLGLPLVRQGAEIQIVQLSAIHHAAIAPHVEPRDADHVERKFVVKLPDFPFDLAGIIDVVEDHRIRDTKTVSPSRVMYADHVAGSMQLSVYALAAHVVDRIAWPVAVTVDNLIKSNPARHHIQAGTRDEQDVERLRRLLVPVARSIKDGVFLPANPDWWGCSRTWCGYWDVCPYVARKE